MSIEKAAKAVADANAEVLVHEEAIVASRAKLIEAQAKQAAARTALDEAIRAVTNPSQPTQP
jgi:hypothetical protein